jgi:hypothetical protein
MSTFELSDGKRTARVNVEEESRVIDLADALGLADGSYAEHDGPVGPVDPEEDPA